MGKIGFFKEKAIKDCIWKEGLLGIIDTVVSEKPISEGNVMLEQTLIRSMIYANKINNIFMFACIVLGVFLFYNGHFFISSTVSFLATLSIFSIYEKGEVSLFTIGENEAAFFANEVSKFIEEKPEKVNDNLRRFKGYTNDLHMAKKTLKSKMYKSFQERYALDIAERFNGLLSEFEVGKTIGEDILRNLRVGVTDFENIKAALILSRLEESVKDMSRDSISQPYRLNDSSVIFGENRELVRESLSEIYDSVVIKLKESLSENQREKEFKLMKDLGIIKVVEGIK